MSKKVFDQIAEGLNEALTVARGEAASCTSPSSRPGAIGGAPALIGGCDAPQTETPEIRSGGMPALQTT